MANNISLKTLAREIKKNAVKVPASVKKLEKLNATPKFGKGWCGKNSGIATDTNWKNVPTRNAFTAHQRERGDNRALMAAMVAVARGE